MRYRLGRESAIAFAKLGAKVVVNDLAHANDVVQEIKAAGGQAVASNVSVENGDAIVKTAIATWGRIDILVNNPAATVENTTTWQTIIDTHLRNTYKVVKAAWPYMLKQKYGRIINATGLSGAGGDDHHIRMAFATAVSLQLRKLVLMLTLTRMPV